MKYNYRKTADVKSCELENTNARERGDSRENDFHNELQNILERNIGFGDHDVALCKPEENKKLELLGDGDINSTSGEMDDEILKIELETKLVDEQEDIEQEEAEEEFRRTIAENTAVFSLPTVDTFEKEKSGAKLVVPSDIRERINEMLNVLADFKRRREPNRSRSDYITQLTSDLAEVFGYLPELVEYFLTMFNPSETLEFLEASESQRPLVIRTNTLKTRRKDLAASLLKRGVTLDPLANWSKVGLKIISSPIPIGATPEYLSGQYMLQSASSFCPVLALNPNPGQEVVLDMSAAPGGKTSYLAQLMRNTGIIIANDLKPNRQKATVANLHRLGVRNVVTSCYDGRKLGSIWRNRFNKILLDAPCSGLGVISRDPSVKVQRTVKDIQRCGKLQKELLLNAIDCLRYKGRNAGILVYSTCSVSVTENEDVVHYILGKRDVKLLDTGLDFGKPGFTRYQRKRFHPSLSLTRRFYPHVHNMDGFYVAKFQKISDHHENSIDSDTACPPSKSVKNDKIDIINTEDKATGVPSRKKKRELSSSNKPKKMLKKKSGLASTPPTHTC